MDLLRAAGAFEITGLPLHPLLVHAVVILTPLTALALILGSLWPAAQRRLGIVTPLGALLLVGLVPVTVAAGESLQQLVGARPDIDAHGGYGRMLLPWVIAMLVVSAVQWAWFRWGARGADTPRRGARAVSILLAVLAIAVAIGTTVLVVLIGDSGARAVWGGLIG